MFLALVYRFDQWIVPTHLLPGERMGSPGGRATG
jgi:hypothetical protein